LDDDIKNLVEEIYFITGYDFRSYRPETFQRRISLRMMDTKCSTYQDYLIFLKNHPAEREPLVNSVTIKVSHFFRNPLVFEVLYNEVLPKVITSKMSDKTPQLRIWFAGCAGGEEVYSTAILIRELENKRFPGLKAFLLATDIDRQALEFARAGIYNEAALTEVKKGYLDKYFQVEGKYYKVNKWIQEIVSFGYYDLVAAKVPSPPSGLFTNYDLIFCRNVLMYYNEPVNQQIFKRLLGCLNNPGYIILGEAESLLPNAINRLQEVYPKLRIYKNHHS